MWLTQEKTGHLPYQLFKFKKGIYCTTMYIIMWRIKGIICSLEKKKAIYVDDSLLQQM